MAFATLDLSEKNSGIALGYVLRGFEMFERFIGLRKFAVIEVVQGEMKRERIFGFEVVLIDAQEIEAGLSHFGKGVPHREKFKASGEYRHVGGIELLVKLENAVICRIVGKLFDDIFKCLCSFDCVDMGLL